MKRGLGREVNPKSGVDSHQTESESTKKCSELQTRFGEVGRGYPVQSQKPQSLETTSGVAPLQLPTRAPETVAAEAVADVRQLLRVLGEHCPCENLPRSPPNCMEQGEVASNPGAIGVVEDVLRTNT